MNVTSQSYFNRLCTYLTNVLIISSFMPVTSLVLYIQVYQVDFLPSTKALLGPVKNED